MFNMWGDGRKSSFRCVRNVTMQNLEAKPFRFNTSLEKHESWFYQRIAPVSYMMVSSLVTCKVRLEPMGFDLKNFDIIQDIFIQMSHLATVMGLKISMLSRRSLPNEQIILLPKIGTWRKRSKSIAKVHDVTKR